MSAKRIEVPRGKSEKSKRKKEVLEMNGPIKYDASH